MSEAGGAAGLGGLAGAAGALVRALDGGRRRAQRQVGTVARRAVATTARRAGGSAAAATTAAEPGRDALTGLPDRTHLHALAATALAPGAPARALLLLDLDGFKQLNDAAGHAAGDRVLQEVAARLARAAGAGDLVVRLGGDEFVVLTEPLTGGPADGLPDARADALPDPLPDARADALADALLDAVAAPVQVDDAALRVGASVGVAVLGRDGSTLEELLRAADQAMYAAKAAGVTAGLRRRSSRGGWVDGVDDDVLVDDLRAALEAAGSGVRTPGGDGGGDGGGGLLLHHQPQVAWDGEVTGFEALLRWHHPTLGLLGPRRFLPVAQRAGLLGRLTLVALEQALAAHPALADAGRSVTVSVNVSARDLLVDGFADRVAERLAAAGVAPDRLVLEIAEPPAFPTPSTVEVFHRLAALGVGISVHEFGARQSSLAALAHHPGIREVKVDPTLVRQVPGDEGITRLVRAITGAAHELGVEVVAEGVEHAAVVPALRGLGVDRLQGFWLAPPAALPATLAWARRWPAERELRLTEQ